MRPVSTLIALLLLITITKVYPATFVVTSKADNGPGTLREALQKAADNGTTETDNINFNLPGGTDNDRTIRLRSQLPNVTSKVIIDGTTQPSTPFGASDARVIIEREFKTDYYSGLVLGTYDYLKPDQTTDIEIYGLYIRNFADITSLSNVNTYQGNGIVISYKVNNIKIGKPGHGNVICGNIYGILVNYDGYYSTGALGNISIQSNFIGVMDNGTTANTNYVGISAALYENSITIGGDNAGEGNVIAANGTDISLSRSNYSLRATLNIVGNKIGTDYTGTKDFKDLPIFSQTSAVQMYGVKVDAQNSDLNIFKNIISGHQTCGVYVNQSTFTIAGNYIGTGTAKTEQLGNNVGIQITGSAQGTIGGSAASDPNYIGYNTFGVDVLSSNPVIITRNSIYCNDRFGIGKAPSAAQTFIQVLKQRSDYISGRSNPNAVIELFYSDNCSGTCQGKHILQRNVPIMTESGNITDL